MSGALRKRSNRFIAILLSTILLLCLMGAGDACDALGLSLATTQMAQQESAELEWREQGNNVLCCVPYMGNGLRARNIAAGKEQGARFRHMGHAFLLALFAVLFKVTAISCCVLFLIWLYLKIFDLQTMIVCFLHEQDGKKRLIPNF